MAAFTGWKFLVNFLLPPPMLLTFLLVLPFPRNVRKGILLFTNSVLSFSVRECGGGRQQANTANARTDLCLPERRLRLTPLPRRRHCCRCCCWQSAGSNSCTWRWCCPACHSSVSALAASHWPPPAAPAAACMQVQQLQQLSQQLAAANPPPLPCLHPCAQTLASAPTRRAWRRTTTTSRPTSASACSPRSGARSATSGSPPWPSRSGGAWRRGGSRGASAARRSRPADLLRAVQAPLCRRGLQKQPGTRLLRLAHCSISPAHPTVPCWRAPPPPACQPADGAVRAGGPRDAHPRPPGRRRGGAQ